MKKCKENNLDIFLEDQHTEKAQLKSIKYGVDFEKTNESISSCV